MHCNSVCCLTESAYNFSHYINRFSMPFTTTPHWYSWNTANIHFVRLVKTCSHSKVKILHFSYRGSNVIVLLIVFIIYNGTAKPQQMQTIFYNADNRLGMFQWLGRMYGCSNFYLTHSLYCHTVIAILLRYTLMAGVWKSSIRGWIWTYSMQLSQRTEALDHGSLCMATDQCTALTLTRMIVQLQSQKSEQGKYIFPYTFLNPMQCSLHYLKFSFM